MENKSNNSGLKAIIVVLLLLLLGSIGYIFMLNSEKNEIVTTLTEEKDNLSNELKAKIAEYDIIIADNTALKEELEAEQAKMVELLEQVEKFKGDALALSKYKEQYFRLKREMDNLIAENKILKAKNEELTSSLDSTNVVLSDAKKINDTLVNQNEKLSKTIEKGSKLSVLNLKVVAMKQKSSGKQIETDRASKADLLKVSFLIAENQIAKKGTRDYYVQIIDSKNNILGEKKTIPVKDKSLTYSFITSVKYENSSVQINEDVQAKEFSKGTYFINIFDKEANIISRSSFNLY